jgi:hypothetical protein
VGFQARSGGQFDGLAVTGCVCKTRQRHAILYSFLPMEKIGLGDSQASQGDLDFWYRWYREFGYNLVGESDFNLPGNEP